MIRTTHQLTVTLPANLLLCGRVEKIIFSSQGLLQSSQKSPVPHTVDHQHTNKRLHDQMYGVCISTTGWLCTTEESLLHWEQQEALCVLLCPASLHTTMAFVQHCLQKEGGKKRLENALYRQDQERDRPQRTSVRSATIYVMPEISMTVIYLLGLSKF